MTDPMNVALAGATGMLGQPVLKHLLCQGFAVTVLSRDESNSKALLQQKYSSGNLSFKEIDYRSIESIRTAIVGHAVVVSTLARAAQRDEERLIDACIAAGVPRFIPSAFGGDMTVAWVRSQPFWEDKLEQEAYLLRKVQENKETFSYNMFTNGPVFEFVLQMKLFINIPERTIVFYDEGEKFISVTTKDTIGRAVAESLKLLDDTKNKNFYIQDAVVNQRQLFRLAQELTPGEEWSITNVQSEPLWKQAVEKWESGARGFAAGPGFLIKGLFSEGFGGSFKKTDNDLLNISIMSEARVKELLSSYL